jgi:hypothetical protein
MFQSEMTDLMSGFSLDLLPFGHEEEIENQVTEILLQDFNEFQEFAQNHQDDGFNKKDLMDEALNDMYYQSAKPSDITGQTLAVTMEADKNKVLNSMALPPTTSQLAEDHANNSKVQQLPSTWMEATTVDLAAQPKEVQASNNNGIQETQEVIEEIQEFLDQFADEGMDQNDEVRNLADELLSEGQKATLESMDVTDCPLANSTLNDEESAAAEDLLDQLIHGNFTSDEIKELEQSFATSNDTGYSSATPSINVSNVSEIITEDGQNIIIVIAPSNHAEAQSFTMAPAPTATNEMLAPLNVPSTQTPFEQSEVDGDVSEDESNNSGEDSDWLPDNESTTRRTQLKTLTATPKNKPGRRLQERTNSGTSSAVSNGRVNKIKSVKDRKERKKLQNVEAARRYRDKKKAEEMKVGDEESQLMKKNAELKDTLNGVEGELNTIKKLMTELGLIKLVTPTSRVK